MCCCPPHTRAASWSNLFKYSHARPTELVMLFTFSLLEIRVARKGPMYGKRVLPFFVYYACVLHSFINRAGHQVLLFRSVACRRHPHSTFHSARLYRFHTPPCESDKAEIANSEGISRAPQTAGSRGRERKSKQCSREVVGTCQGDFQLAPAVFTSPGRQLRLHFLQHKRHLAFLSVSRPRDYKSLTMR